MRALSDFGIPRRRLHRPMLALLAATAILLVAGCGHGHSSQSAANAPSSTGAKPVATEIGYMPILPDAQLFVNLADGDLARAGIKPKLISFQNGPAMVQALASGQLDIAYFGIGPTMVARAKGADIRVVASNIVEQISIVALGPLAHFFEDGPARTAFARFAKAKGRKAKISTFPVGSVPATVFAYWLQKKLGIADSSVQTVYQGASQVQQSLLTGAVDGAAILEPVVSIVEHRDPKARVVASGADLFENQPGAVMAVRASFLKAHPQIVQKLVAAHIKATHALNAAQPKAIDALQKYVGGGRLSRSIIKTAVDHSKGHFVANPHQIIAATQRMYQFQKQQGTLKANLNIDTLFDTRFYDQAVKSSADTSDKQGR